MAELVFMAEAHRRMVWEPQSMFMTLFANANRNPKKKAFKIDNFFPFHIESRREYSELPKADISDLKFIVKDFGK